MHQLSLFPDQLGWSSAIDDIGSLPETAERVRLVSKAKGFYRLPTLKNLKHLWCFGINQEKLTAIGGCRNLVTLFIEGLRCSDVEPLAQLRDLEILSLQDCSKIASLSWLSNHRDLRGLEISNFKNVRSLEELSEVT